MDYEYVFDAQNEIDFESDESYDEFPEENPSQNQLLEQSNEQTLPITAYKSQILDLIESNQISIICGTTGSGKTTQIPQYLTKYGKVACTQPRRLAATAVATRVAKEVGTKLGREVGYSVRFDNCTSRNTEIKFLTDGILMREFLLDRDLIEYSAIMIDEAHERTLHTDIILTLLKQVCKRRPELKVVISSATLDSSKFKSYFNDAPVYNVPGRIFPVDVYYTKDPEANYLYAALMTVLQIHLNASSKPGDVLVFLPGQDEIETMADNLNEARNKLGSSVDQLIVCPVYANLPPSQQQRIFDPTPQKARKIVLATNIAETSLTISGITYVIDPGFVKQKEFNPRSGMDSLNVKECSQASANQRKGRAGRLQAGMCYRLYPKSAFQDLPKEATPEILRTNLAGVVLLLMSIGVRNVMDFDFIDKPSSDSLVQALQVLYSLGAINANCELTKTGRKMIELPVEPIMAKTILAAHKMGSLDDTILIIAMLGELGSVFYRPKKRKQEADAAHAAMAQPGGDHMTLLYVYKEWENNEFSPQWCYDHYVQHKVMIRARNVARQLKSLCKRLLVYGSQEKSDRETISRAFVGGYVTNLAKLSNNGEFYTTIATNTPVFIHPSSTLHGETPKYVVYNEIVVTSKEFMRGCLAVDEEMVVTGSTMGTN